jgi:PBSX family phage terminase large subunit
LDEFKTEDDVQVIVDSILRAELPHGLKYKIFYSYNPPKRKQNWVNKKFETQFTAPNVYIHHSTYLTNPYLTKQVLEEIEHTKETKPLKYKWMYLGEAIGGGIVPFDNLRFEKISNELFNSFNNIRQGLDWGYAVDPMAFGRWHYDKTRRLLWAMDEIYGIKLSNRFVADEIKRRGYHTDKITADSAEPKSIAELKSYGINRIAGAKKGAGSVEYGEKWLDDLEGIVIDYNRTPNTAREFENIDYQVDKDGNPKSKLEDKDNHTIDNARYACEDDMKSNTSINWLK